MTAAALSDDAVIEARPVFVIDGEHNTALGEDLQRLDMQADETGFSCLEAVFLNWDRSSDLSAVDFVHDVSGDLDFGKSIRVTAGGADRRTTIFEGRVTALQGDYPQGRPPELTVRANDALFWLGLGQHTRLHEQSTDSAMAEAVAGQGGTAVSASAEGPDHRALWQINQTDLAFLLERARAVDAAVLVEDRQIVFRPRRVDGEQPILLTRYGDLLRFSVCADLVHQRAEVRVHGYSVADKGGIHERAGSGDATAEAEGGGRTGAAILGEIHDGSVEHLHLDMPVTAEEARRLAEARMRARSRAFLRASGTTSGTPSMKVGSRVNVTDVGPHFSGVYVVVKLRHTFDQAQGFRTHFQAERADIGRVS